MCNGCRYNTDDVCVLYKSIHPSRDAVVSVGLQMPRSACPAGLWPRVEWSCGECGYITRNESGVSVCEQCGAIPPRRVSLPYVARFAHEEPWEPTQPRLIVTLANETSHITETTIAAYADKCGADFRTLTDESKGYPAANAFRLAMLATNYDRVLWLAPDIAIRSDAPDIFAFPSGAVYASDDDAVVLFDGSQSSIWTAPYLPIADQSNAVSRQLREAIREDRIPAGTLDMRWNWRWDAKGFDRGVSRAFFVNLSTCPKADRAEKLSYFCSAS
jgi:hypothetical protein